MVLEHLSPKQRISIARMGKIWRFLVNSFTSPSILRLSDCKVEFTELTKSFYKPSVFEREFNHLDKNISSTSSHELIDEVQRNIAKWKDFTENFKHIKLSLKIHEQKALVLDAVYNLLHISGPYDIVRKLPLEQNQPGYLAGRYDLGNKHLAIIDENDLKEFVVYMDENWDQMKAYSRNSTKGEIVEIFVVRLGNKMQLNSEFIANFFNFKVAEKKK